jgi:hypothetical protein
MWMIMKNIQYPHDEDAQQFMRVQRVIPGFYIENSFKRQ